MKRYLLLILLPFTIAACKHMGEGNHLPPEKMGPLLRDIHIAEAYSSMAHDSLHRAGMKNIDSLAVFYKEIFAHYKITAADFDESMAWYKDHPEEMDTLYVNMLKDFKPIGAPVVAPTSAMRPIIPNMIPKNVNTKPLPKSKRVD